MDFFSKAPTWAGFLTQIDSLPPGAMIKANTQMLIMMKSLELWRSPIIIIIFITHRIHVWNIYLHRDYFKSLYNL